MLRQLTVRRVYDYISSEIGASTVIGSAENGSTEPVLRHTHSISNNLVAANERFEFVFLQEGSCDVRSEPATSRAALARMNTVFVGGIVPEQIRKKTVIATLEVG